MPKLDNTTEYTRRRGIQLHFERLRKQHRTWPMEKIAAEAKRQWAAQHQVKA